MTAFGMRSTRTLFTLVVALQTVKSLGSVIPPDRTVTWTPGVTVGILQPIPNRTTIIDVTQAPYYADKTGQTNAANAINQAITAAGYWIYGSNTVIYLPAGQYRITTPINIAKSDLTLRGDGMGQTFVNSVGSQTAVSVGTSGNTASYPIISGATKGSTSVVIQTPSGFVANTYGYLSVGDLCSVNEQPRDASDPMHVISPAYGLGGISAGNYVTAITGNTVSLALPLPLDLTNNPSLGELTFNSMGGLQCVSAVGLEGISFTMTNPPTGEAGTGPEVINVVTARNFWMTNCEVSYANQHFALFGSVVGAYIGGCEFDSAQAVGSGHGGMVTANMCGGLVENNIFANMYTSGIELDGGWGCAFFGNYFTNTGWCVDMHGTHPLMELFEANISGDTFETDDYFGSCSHFTLFRNNLTGGAWNAIRFNRWSRFMNIVGNVLGSPGSWNYQVDENSQAFPAIYSFGLPNIGNQFFAGVVTNDAAWNWPGTNYFDYAGSQTTVPYTPFVFHSTRGPTNVFPGNFAATGIHPYSTVLRLIFQDGVDPSAYYTINSGNGVYPVSMTSSSMTINTPFTVTNGWTMYVAGAVGYQQIQATDKQTHMITGNFDYHNNAVVWDTNGVQTVDQSLLYPGGQPPWWSGAWPAIDAVNSPGTASIPAQNRYLGILNSVSLSFTASPMSVTNGGTTTLTWSSANATNVTINGIGTVNTAGGSVNVTQAGRTTYTANASGPSGTVTKTVTVSLKLTPPVLENAHQ